MRDPRWLLSKSRRVYSQTGEDGVVGAILDLFTDPNKWCVEFGAMDGKKLSNTRHLIESRDYNAVLIEADKRSFAALSKTYSGSERVHPVRATVGFTPADSLDKILSSTRCPKDFDFLSIDIDGNDIRVWRATTVYSPRLVCIEFNPTIPTSVYFEQPADSRAMMNLPAFLNSMLFCPQRFVPAARNTG